MFWCLAGHWCEQTVPTRTSFPMEKLQGSLQFDYCHDSIRLLSVPNLPHVKRRHANLINLYVKTNKPYLVRFSVGNQVDFLFSNSTILRVEYVRIHWLSAFGNEMAEINASLAENRGNFATISPSKTTNCIYAENSFHRDNNTLLSIWYYKEKNTFQPIFRRENLVIFYY